MAIISPVITPLKTGQSWTRMVSLPSCCFMLHLTAWVLHLGAICKQHTLWGTFSHLWQKSWEAFSLWHTHDTALWSTWKWLLHHLFWCLVIRLCIHLMPGAVILASFFHKEQSHQSLFYFVPWGNNLHVPPGRLLANVLISGFASLMFCSEVPDFICSWSTEL